MWRCRWDSGSWGGGRRTPSTAARARACVPAVPAAPRAAAVSLTSRSFVGADLEKHTHENSSSNNKKKRRKGTRGKKRHSPRLRNNSTSESRGTGHGHVCVGETEHKKKTKKERPVLWTINAPRSQPRRKNARGLQDAVFVSRSRRPALACLGCLQQRRGQQQQGRQAEARCDAGTRGAAR